MEYEEMKRRAKEAMRAKQERRHYFVSWRGNSEVKEYVGIAGCKALCALLGISEHSLRCYFARGGGSFERELTNPLTGEPDVALITRRDPLIKERRPRGRPRKEFDLDRLGTEFAESARTVPEYRNRRTDEK